MSRHKNLWLEFYNNIRDPQWPDCPTETQFCQLPEYIQKEIIELHDGQRYIKINDNDIEDWPITYCQEDNKTDDFDPECLLRFSVGNGVEIHYDQIMDGGGTTFGQLYPKVLKYLYPDRKFNNVLEWCCGPGFINFRLLADGLAENIFLMDAFLPSLKSCKITESNLPEHLKNRTTIIHADDVRNIPKEYKFDLIVSNPPWFSTLQYFDANTNRIGMDKDWQAHKNFFHNIKSHLAQDGIILFQETILGSNPPCFEQFIQEGGLKITRCLREKLQPEYWYLEVRHG